MRLNLVMWSAPVVVILALLAVAPGVLKPTHLHWPVRPIALMIAIVAALPAATKPVSDAIADGWATLTKRHLELQELECKVGGRE